MAGKRSLMGVYGHPDDEQGVSGLMAKYARAGVEVTLVCGTRGEAGEIAPGVEANAENLGSVRENELRCAADKIGVSNLYFLDYRDSGMAGTAENNDPRCLCQANVMEVAEKVVRLVRRHKPQVILTFDPNGGYGHPDHIKAHQAAMMAYFVAGDARIFPEHIREGLEPWTPSKLYWGAFTRGRFQQAADMAREMGIQMSIPLQELLRRATPDACVTTRVDVTDFVELKLDALSCHASQLDPNNVWQKIPPEIRREGMKIETLIRAESRTAPSPQDVETDLFQGIE